MHMLDNTVSMYNRILRDAGESEMDDCWMRSISVSAVVASASGGHSDKDRVERRYVRVRGGDPVWWLSSLSW